MVATTLALLAWFAVTQEQSRPIPPAAWVGAYNGASTHRDGDVLQVRGGSGWVRTPDTFLDFTLRLRFRRVTPDAEGAVLLRLWTDPLSPADGQMTGYRLHLRPARSAGEVLSLLGAFSTETPISVHAAHALDPDTEWHALQISCERDHVSVAVDDEIILEANGTEPGAGYIGLQPKQGAIEYQDVTVEEHGPNRSKTKFTGPSADARPGFKPPTVATQVKPRYTAEAMANRLMGTVAMECVIGADGTVKDIRITKALDRGLDLQAVAAARHWKFTPALEGETPIPVVAKIEMDFKLH